jgi:hypothetical protein
MGCVGPSANETFAFGIMCFETRSILKKLAWPTWNYGSATMRITDRPSADRGIGHQQVARCSPIASQPGTVARAISGIRISRSR